MHWLPRLRQGTAEMQDCCGRNTLTGCAAVPPQNKTLAYWPPSKPRAPQMLDALVVLRDSRIIHCDLKPENVSKWQRTGGAAWLAGGALRPSSQGTLGCALLNLAANKPPWPVCRYRCC